MSRKRISLQLTGIVQGVGMRPTLYRYALEHHLVGYVMNTAQGVILEAEGEENNIAAFLNQSKNNPPPLARVDSFIATDLPLKHDHSFEIIRSHNAGEKNVEISPDIATCKDCLTEILDPNDRRYLYPFTNCTNCGPRFTIIKDRPYDRSLTSMNEFVMCPECQSEYDNPLDRRFHAQPNACPRCGPKLFLLGVENTNDPFMHTIQLLKEEKIAGIKGLGGFNLACDATSKNAVQNLRKRKQRPTRSFAVMVKDIDTIKKYCHVSLPEEKILRSPAAPIVLLQKSNLLLDHLSPDNNYLGVMLPYTPLHHLLARSFEILVMTSANRADEPIATTDSEMTDLIQQGLADFALTHNRAIVHRADDSIIQMLGEKQQIIRRSRGFVPTPLQVEAINGRPTLSLGANMKNTFALREGKKIFISQHIGELIDVRNYDFQQKEIQDFKNLLNIHPENNIGDAHPGYENYNSSYTHVYHHHAHMLSCMGEHHLLAKNVLGVICDGTGFGPDQTIWGFEFLLTNGDPKNFERIGYLRPFPLPGGERAITEVDRIGIVLSMNGPGTHYNSDRKKQIEMLLEKNLNCPRCSSLGRLFDGVASLLNLVQHTTYEAQAAMLLQKEAEDFRRTPSKKYTVCVAPQKPHIVDYHTMIAEIFSDLQKRISPQEIAYKFHLWIVDSILAVIRHAAQETVVFSGGCFQNMLLSRLIIDAMKKENVAFFMNEKVPANDAGISFGQAIFE